MTARLAGWGLVGLAVAVFAGVSAPTRTKVQAAEAELAAAREQGSAQRGPEDARSAEMARVVSRLLKRRGRGGDPVLSARRAALAAVPGPGVRIVSLAVHPARAPLAAAVSLSAEGQLSDLCRLISRLTRDGGGLVLERVTLVPAPAGALVRIEAQAVAADTAAGGLDGPGEGVEVPRRDLPRIPRDPFRYVAEGMSGLDESPTAGQQDPARAVQTEASEASPEEATEPVRLVGLVHQRGTLKAALSVGGQVAVVAAGETYLGFRVVAIDADQGVRVEGPDGWAAVLPVNRD